MEGVDMHIYIQGVPKKSGISVQRSFYALKWPKIKKSKETDPPLKLNFTYKEVFSALYTTCIHRYTLGCPLGARFAEF